MEVAPRYNCWHYWHCWYCWHCSTLLTWHIMSYHFIHICLVPIFNRKEAEGWNALWKVIVTRMSRNFFKLTVQEGVQEYFLIHCHVQVSHAVVQNYFLIHCRTRASRIIFKLPVASGGQGLFSNWMSHAGVKEYFLIDCRTRVSRSIF